VVWGTEASGSPLYRCLVAHSGSSTPPKDDPTRWRFISSVTSVDPLSGPSAETLVYDTRGRVVSGAFTQDGKSGGNTLVWGGDDNLYKVSTSWAGRQRNVTLRYDGNGGLAGYTASDANELINSLFRPGAFPAEWATVTGDPAVASIIAESSAATGFVLRVGKDIGGNDCVFMRHGTLIEINDTALYRLRCRYRIVSGDAGVIYAGVACRNAENTAYVNRSNAESSNLGLSHYAVNAAKPALGVWQTGEYYYKGRSSGASTGTGTLSNPITFASLAKYFTIMHVANHNNQSGKSEFDYIIVEEVPA